MLFTGIGLVEWLEWLTVKQKVVGSNPEFGRKVFFSLKSVHTTVHLNVIQHVLKKEFDDIRAIIIIYLS